jgi:PhoD-like phosphatase, N-terminal domain/PhoD-like phosphatase
MVVVSPHGVPTAEMFAAETLKEYQRLLNHGGYSINETLRDQVQAQRQRNLQGGLELSQPLLANAFGGVAGFYHGVASGDPLPNAVILWTRYTPLTASDVVTLELRVATVTTNSSVPLNDHLDPTRNPSIKRVLIEVTNSSDWVAKVDVTGLPSRTKLVYAFSDGTTVSDIGQSTTAPTVNDETVSELRYAVFSCANYGNGYFHAYDVASTITDLDFWIHVGDYIVRFGAGNASFLGYYLNHQCSWVPLVESIATQYEYGSYSTYASDSPTRKAEILPLWEAIDLQDYRLRYATYHRDEGLCNLRYENMCRMLSDAFVCIGLTLAAYVACCFSTGVEHQCWQSGMVRTISCANCYLACGVTFKHSNLILFAINASQTMKGPTIHMAKVQLIVCVFPCARVLLCSRNYGPN